jgi:hypothetical protein
MADLTIITNPRTIRLKGQGVRLERPAAGTITPGHLVKLGAANTLVVNSVALTKCPLIFALENELVGLGIDDNYVSGDLVQAEHMYPGQWVNALVAASAAALVIGDFVEPAADGTVRKFTSGTQLGVVMVAVDNSTGTAVARAQIALF